jgi:hypothetical protein
MLGCQQNRYPATVDKRPLFTEPLPSNGCCIFAHFAVVAEQRFYMPNINHSSPYLFKVRTIGVNDTSSSVYLKLNVQQLGNSSTASFPKLLCISVQKNTSQSIPCSISQCQNFVDNIIQQLAKRYQMPQRTVKSILNTFSENSCGVGNFKEYTRIVKSSGQNVYKTTDPVYLSEYVSSPKFTTLILTSFVT